MDMIGKLENLDKMTINHKDAKDAFMSVLVGPSEGWDDYVMRVVSLEEGGHTPRHEHPWEHINFILVFPIYLLRATNQSICFIFLYS